MKALFKPSIIMDFLVISVFCLILCHRTTFAAQGGVSLPAGAPPVRMMMTDPGPIGINTTTALFSQVAIGGGYTTVFTLLNTGGTDLTGVLILTAGNGSPMTATFTAPPAAPATGSSFEIGPLHSGGTQFITASPANPAEATVTGWGRVESSGGTLGGVGTFQFTAGGKLTTVAGVLAGNPVNVATVPVDNDGAANRFTGYAIANPSNANINVKIVVVNVNGVPMQTLNLPQLNPLGPRQQVARFLHQDVQSLLTFQGSMVLIAQPGEEFSVVALVLDQGLITAVPVIPSKAPGIN
jgi:hypothetical protein